MKDSQDIGCIQRKSIFDISFISSNLNELSSHLCQLAQKRDQPTLISHTDVHVLTRALHDKENYGHALSQFDYTCPDGMPIVWLLRRKRKESRRIYGPDMMEIMLEKGCCKEAPLRHFLLGGSEEAQKRLKEKFTTRHPHIQIAGAYSPPMGQWPEGCNEDIATRIEASGANCVWVGLGCPKQELWLAHNAPILPPALYFAVGAAFNFHAGLVDQAPLWIRSFGFEWLYRLCKEPRRLAKRYLVHNSLFFYYLITRKI